MAADPNLIKQIVDVIQTTGFPIAVAGYFLYRDWKLQKEQLVEMVKQSALIEALTKSLDETRHDFKSRRDREKEKVSGKVVP